VSWLDAFSESSIIQLNLAEAFIPDGAQIKASVSFRLSWESWNMCQMQLWIGIMPLFLPAQDILSELYFQA
jgi:hypothetical protein